METRLPAGRQGMPRKMINSVTGVEWSVASEV